MTDSPRTPKSILKKYCKIATTVQETGLTKMESLSFTQKSMNYLINNLTRLQVDQCSDEFLTTLNKLIAVSTKLVTAATANRSRAEMREKRRNSCTSSLSDDCLYIPTDIQTVQVDSDSEESIISIGRSTPNASTSSNVQSKTVVENTTTPSPRLKRVNSSQSNESGVRRCVVNLRRMSPRLKRVNSSQQLNESGARRCVVKLRRIDETLANIQLQSENSDPGPVPSRTANAIKQRRQTRYYEI